MFLRPLSCGSLPSAAPAAGDLRHRDLRLVHHAVDDRALAGHHRLIAGPGDIGRIVLLRRADLGVHHVGALEEFGVGGAGLEAGDGDSGVLELVA
jgi:hypothetical protein